MAVVEEVPAACPSNQGRRCFRVPCHRPAAIKKKNTHTPVSFIGHEGNGKFCLENGKLINTQTQAMFYDRQYRFWQVFNDSYRTSATKTPVPNVTRHVGRTRKYTDNLINTTYLDKNRLNYLD